MNLDGQIAGVEGLMGGEQSGPRIFLGDEEGKIGFRGTVGNGEDAHLLLLQGTEGAGGQSGSGGHALANQGDESDERIEDDLSGFLLRNVVGKFTLQGFDSVTGGCRRDDETNFTLRRGLRNQQDL